jgi:hypothetical protein
VRAIVYEKPNKAAIENVTDPHHGYTKVVLKPEGLAAG